MERWTDHTPTDATIRRGLRVRPGVAFDVVTEASPADPISKELSGGIFPPLLRPLVELVEAIVPPGGRVLDLGSHVGTFSLAVAATGRRVVGVEASPRNFALLDYSRKINEFHDLRTFHAAIAEGPGTLRFFSNGPFGHVDPGDAHPDAVEIRAVAADDLLEEIGWDRVEFIKMDIEGSEIAGLVGLSRLLTRPDAPPVFVESNGHTLHLFGESPATLKATLVAYGYSLFQVEDRRLIPVELDEFQGTVVVDYLAIKGPLPSWRRWRVDGPMPLRERIRRARASCLSPLTPERQYAARSIGLAPEPIRTDYRIVKAIEALKADPDEVVRRAAEGWSFTAKARPWYAFWRR